MVWVSGSGSSGSSGVLVPNDVSKIVIAHGASDLDNVGREAVNDRRWDFKIVARVEVAFVWFMSLGFVVSVDIADVNFVGVGLMIPV